MNLQEQLKYDKLQLIRKRLHAKKIEENTQDAVNTTMETTSMPTANATMDITSDTKEKDPNIVELDTENYGAPPENSGIAVYKNGMKSPNASLTKPQAWEDEKGNWYYNFAGAIQLAKSLGRTLPNIDQLVAAINANPDNFRQNVGDRSGDDGKFYERGEFSNFWSSSESGSNSAPYACLKQGASSAGRHWSYRRHGLSVRFIVDTK